MITDTGNVKQKDQVNKQHLVIDTNQMVPVRIDSKTVIFILPGKDPEQARSRFLDACRRNEVSTLKSRIPEII